jgi:hypothetical protein
MRVSGRAHADEGDVLKLLGRHAALGTYSGTEMWPRLIEVCSRLKRLLSSDYLD